MRQTTWTLVDRVAPSWTAQETEYARDRVRAHSPNTRVCAAWQDSFRQKVLDLRLIKAWSAADEYVKKQVIQIFTERWIRLFDWMQMCVNVLEHCLELVIKIIYIHSNLITRCT